MSEHEPIGYGTVDSIGDYDVENRVHKQMDRVAQKVEVHGEVHAVFEHLDYEVEFRLGTLRLDYDTETFEVWDGDNYQTFNARNLVHVYKPMEFQHV